MSSAEADLTEADLTKDASALAAPEKAGRSFASDKRRVALLMSVALVLAAGIASSAWWFLSPPLSTAAEWGGIGRESVIVGIRTENGGRFDVRVTGIDAEGSSAAARLDSVGLRSSPMAPRVETFAPITLKPGERTYVVLTYRIRCDEVTSSGGSLGGIAIRYDIFGIGALSTSGVLALRRSYRPTALAADVLRPAPDDFASPPAWTDYPGVLSSLREGAVGTVAERT
jgi:hypothetical protein